MAAREQQFYIGGFSVAPHSDRVLSVVDPSHEEVFERIALGSAADVDNAVAAARRAFPNWSQTTPAGRGELRRRIVDNMKRRAEDLAASISREMGAPRAFALIAR